MKRLLALCFCAALLIACTDPVSVTGTDDESAADLRIVSLAPHLTELIYTAGAGDRLVGVVAYSDYPEQARSLPIVGDAFRIDPERLATVEPNLILAWQGGNPDAVIDQLVSRGYTVARLASNNLSDVGLNLTDIGKLTGTADTAEDAARQFNQALEQLREAHATQSVMSVFYQISPQPLYTVGGGHPISDIISLCGGKNLFDDLEQLAPIVGLEDVLSRNPDVIIASDERSQLEQWSRWSDLNAVTSNNLYVVDASLVTRPSTRMLQGAQQICAYLKAARTKLAD